MILRSKYNLYCLCTRHHGVPTETAQSSFENEAHIQLSSIALYQVLYRTPNPNRTALSLIGYIFIPTISPVDRAVDGLRRSRFERCSAGIVNSQNFECRARMCEISQNIVALLGTNNAARRSLCLRQQLHTLLCSKPRNQEARRLGCTTCTRQKKYAASLQGAFRNRRTALYCTMSGEKQAFHGNFSLYCTVSTVLYHSQHKHLCLGRFCTNFTKVERNVQDSSHANQNDLSIFVRSLLAFSLHRDNLPTGFNIVSGTGSKDIVSSSYSVLPSLLWRLLLQYTRQSANPASLFTSVC